MVNISTEVKELAKQLKKYQRRVKTLLRGNDGWKDMGKCLRGFEDIELEIALNSDWVGVDDMDDYCEAVPERVKLSRTETRRGRLECVQYIFTMEDLLPSLFWQAVKDIKAVTEY